MLKLARLSNKIISKPAFPSTAAKTTNLNFATNQLEKSKVQVAKRPQIINPLEHENFFQTNELVNMEDMFK